MDMLDGGRLAHPFAGSRGWIAGLFVALMLGSLWGGLSLVGPAGAESDLPNLVVDDVELFVSDWRYGHTVRLTLTNLGGAFSQPIATKLIIDGETESTIHLTGATGAGETRQAITNLGQWWPGTHTLNVTTDNTNSIEESNEGDNRLVKTVNVDTGPDLFVESMEINDSWGGHFVHVVVNNSGAPAFGTFALHVTVPGFIDEKRTVYGMDTNESRTEYFGFSGWQPGEHLVSVQIDPDDAIAETDHGNNEMVRALQAVGGPVLEVRNLTVHAQDIALDRPITLTWEVHNTGTQRAPGVPVNVNIVGGALGVARTATVVPGGVQRMSVWHLMPPGIGGATLRVTFDPEHEWGVVTPGPNTFDVPIMVRQPEPLEFGLVHLANETVWDGETRYERVRLQPTASGDHLASRARLQLFDGDRLVNETLKLWSPQWRGDLLNYDGAENFSWSQDTSDTFSSTFWQDFVVPVHAGHVPAFRAVVRLDNGTAWESVAERVIEDSDEYVPPRPMPPPQPEPDHEDRTPPTPPEPYPGWVRGEPVEPTPERPDPIEEPAQDALPVELEVRHVNTRTDDEHPGASLLRFEVTGLGPGGTSTDLGIVAKVGWQVEVLTSSQDIGEGDTATYDVRLTPPREGRTSSTITVGAWGEAARAEPVVVNVRNLQTAGTAAGHPVPVWGYASGAAVLAAAAGVFVWFAEPRRYGFLRYLLAMFPVVGGFSRIQGEKVLEHEARERIHQVIENQPGVHYRALLRELGMSNGRLAHHLQTLEREGMIRTEAVSGKLHFYVTGSNAVRGTPLTDRQRALLAMIKKEPGILQSRLADRLGVSRQALHQHLDGLRDQNLLIDARFGRTKALYLESDADQRLTVCGSCQSFYDRGQGLTAGVVCPGCGQGI